MSGRASDPALSTSTPRTRPWCRPGMVGRSSPASSPDTWGGMTGKDLREPFPTVTTRGTQDQLVASSLVKLRGASVDADPSEPLHTVSAQGNHHALVSAHIQRDFGSSVGSSADDPLGTITAGGGGKAGLILGFLQSYYGTGIGQALDAPVRTLTTKDRMSHRGRRGRGGALRGGGHRDADAPAARALPGPRGSPTPT